MCPDCQKSFSEQTTLAQHMRTHTNERPHVCQEDGCGKAFTLASALTIHTRMFTLYQRRLADDHSRHPHWRQAVQMPTCWLHLCLCRIVKSSQAHCEYLFMHRDPSSHVLQRTHTGERKFACGVGDCTAKFGRSDQYVFPFPLDRY